MKTIESVIGRDLQWVQPSFFKQTYELRNSRTVVAKLAFPRLLSQEARAESADGCWVFRRKGVWKPTISISTCENETHIISFKSRLWGRTQTFQLPDGEMLVMIADFFGWKYRLQTESGELIVEIKRNGFFKGTYSVNLRRRGSSYKELPWLVMLPWYLMILLRRGQHHA
ncbi:MAG TPA: hypothetical protein VIL52_04320 [Bacteroidota bacterium]